MLILILFGLFFVGAIIYTILNEEFKENEIKKFLGEKYFGIYYACFTNYVDLDITNIRYNLFKKYIAENDVECFCDENNIASKIDFIKNYNQLSTNFDLDSFIKTKYIDYLMRKIFFKYIEPEIENENKVIKDVIFPHIQIKEYSVFKLNYLLNSNKISKIKKYNNISKILSYELCGSSVTMLFPADIGDILCFDCFKNRVTKFVKECENYVDKEYEKIKLKEK